MGIQLTGSVDICVQNKFYLRIRQSAASKWYLDVTVNDELQCQELLHFRDNGISFAAFISKNRRRYLFRGSLLVVAAFLAFSGADAGKIGGIFVAGMILGMVIQDFSWIGGVRNARSLTVRVTNWELVEQIATSQTTSEDGN